MIKWTFVFAILLLGCRPDNKQVSNSLSATLIEKTYNIDTVFHGVNDTEMKAMLILYIDSLDTHLDSLVLTDCYIQDRKIPYHYILDKKLVFEDCKNYPNFIKVLDLEKLEIISELNGFIQIIKADSKPKSIDLENKIVIYFSSEKNIYDTYFINSLDLNNLNTTRLDTIITNGDAIEGTPWVDKIDPTSRQVNVLYIDKDYKRKEDFINY